MGTQRPTPGISPNSEQSSTCFARTEALPNEAFTKHWPEWDEYICRRISDAIDLTVVYTNLLNCTLKAVYTPQHTAYTTSWSILFNKGVEYLRSKLRFHNFTILPRYKNNIYIFLKRLKKGPQNTRQCPSYARETRLQPDRPLIILREASA